VENKEFLMKNHQLWPTSCGPFPEAYATAFPEANATSFKGNHGRGPRRGRRRSRNNVWRREGYNSKSNDKMWGDMKRKRIQHLLKNLKVVIIYVV
jgi:hypothetical protein